MGRKITEWLILYALPVLLALVVLAMGLAYLVRLMGHGAR